MFWTTFAHESIVMLIVAAGTMAITAAGVIWWYRGQLREMYSEGYRTAYMRYRDNKAQTIVLTPKIADPEFTYTHPEWVPDHTDLNGWTRNELMDEIRRVMA